MKRHEAQCLAHRSSRGDADDRLTALPLSAEDETDCRAIAIEHLVFAHPLVAIQLREIPLASVWKDGDDQRFRVIDLSGDRQRDVRDQTAGASDEEAFLAREPPRHRE